VSIVSKVSKLNNMVIKMKNISMLTNMTYFTNLAELTEPMSHERI
jgi:hypothetical protein